jgi:hypothetical protein
MNNRTPKNLSEMYVADNTAQSVYPRVVEAASLGASRPQPHGHSPPPWSAAQ